MAARSLLSASLAPRYLFTNSVGTQPVDALPVMVNLQRRISEGAGSHLIGEASARVLFLSTRQQTPGPGLPEGTRRGRENELEDRDSWPADDHVLQAGSRRQQGWGSYRKYYVPER